MKLGCVPWWVSPPVRPPSGGSAAEPRRLSPAACAPSEHLSARVGLRHKTGGHDGEVCYWELSGLRSNWDVFPKLVIRRLLLLVITTTRGNKKKKSILQMMILFSTFFVFAAFKCSWALPGNGFTGVSLKPTNWICSATSALSAWRDCLQGECLRHPPCKQLLHKDEGAVGIHSEQGQPGIAADTTSDAVMCFRQSVQLHALHVIMLTQVPNFSQFVFGIVVSRW